MFVKSHFQHHRPALLDNERVQKFLAKVEARRCAELVEMQNLPVV